MSIFLLIAPACTSPGQITTTETEVRERSQSLTLERPVPYPIDIPFNFQMSMEEGSRSATGEPGEAYWQNEASYDLKAELLPDENRVKGSATIRYTNHSPDDLDRIVLELSQNLHKAGTMKKENTEITGGIKLHEVTVRGNTIEKINPGDPSYRGEAGYLVDATRMLIVPDSPLLSGNNLEMEINWSFEVPEQGASGRMGRNRGNLFMIAYWYPQVSVYDDVNGWFTDPFLGNAEFYHGFADYELEITAPENWLIMSTGKFLNPEEVLADRILERYRQAGNSDEIVHIVTEADLGGTTRITENGKLTWKFSAKNVRDAAFSATSESLWDGARTPVGDLNGDGQTDYTRINSFYRTSAPLWKDQAEFSQHSITFLSEYLDHPYPWPHMTSVEGAGIIGGGMEFPMMTIIGSYNNLGSQRLHSVTAHEFAHMWVPMIVSTNERRYTWMDEGFTTFNTHQAMVDAYPDDFENLDVFQSYLGIAGTDNEGPMMRWSDYHYPGPAYGVASYPKPASVLTALRGLLGEDLFHEAYLTFFDRWAYKHPQPWDFFNTIEDISGMDLGWFWRSWYYETWVLDHAIGEVTQNNNSVRIEIRDNGNVPMPVSILITFEDGTQQMETVPVDVWLSGKRSTTLNIEAAQPVREVRLDPGEHFPDIDRSNLTWTRNNN
ncbi:MAG: M1 family metallopeptidase [Balneolaceae bacterium]